MSTFRQLAFFSCFVSPFLLSACFFSSYSRRDRFASQIIQAQPALSSAQSNSLLGKPNAVQKSGPGAVKLSPGTELVLKISLPNTYQGYCEALAVHLPKDRQSEGDYRVWISGQVEGPWMAVGRANTSKTFNIDEVRFDRAHYVRIAVSPRTERAVWLDAVHIRVHLPTWRPLLQRTLPDTASPLVRKRAMQRALDAKKQGEAHYEAKAFKLALAQFLEALPMLPRSAELISSIAATYHALDQHFQAIRFFQRAFSLAPPTQTQLEELGESYIALRLLPQALQTFERCNAITPTYPQCYYHKIHIASLARRRDPHLVAFFRDQYLIASVRTREPYRNWPMARVFKGIFHGGRWPRIQTHPHRLSLLRHLGWQTFLMRMFPKAKEVILKDSIRHIYPLVKKGDSWKWKANLYRAALYHNAGHHAHGDKLLQILERSTKSPLLRARIYSARSILYLQQGKSKKATQILKRGLKQTRSAKANTMLQHQLDLIEGREPSEAKDDQQDSTHW